MYYQENNLNKEISENCKITLLFCLTVFLTLFLLISGVNAKGRGREKNNNFTVEVKDKFVSVNAHDASFKKILRELESKTKVKVYISEEVGDKKVTLRISDLPDYSVGLILRRMQLKNYAVVYDQTLKAEVIHVLPEGHDISSVIRDKDVIMRSGRVELSRPRASTVNVKNLVSEDTGRKIVELEAGKRFDRFAVGKPVFCSDDKGKLVAYMFPVKVNADEFPEDEIFISEMKSKIAKGEGGIDWKAGEYWTYVVSARERDFPIPVYSNSLSPYFVTSATAAGVAKKQLNTSRVELTRYYFLGHRGQYYEFSGGDKVILIHAHRLTPYESSRILVRKNETESDVLDKTNKLKGDEKKSFTIYQQQTRDEWNKLKEQIK